MLFLNPAGLRCHERSCSKGFYAALATLDQSVQLKTKEKLLASLRFDLNNLAQRNLYMLHGGFLAEQFLNLQLSY